MSSVKVTIKLTGADSYPYDEFDVFVDGKLVGYLIDASEASAKDFLTAFLIAIQADNVEVV